VAAPVAAAPQAALGGSEPLLLVEDDPLVRNVTVRALRSAGYEVLVACDAREALELAPAEVGRLRLLVSDVVMPGTDGPTMAGELRRRNPALRVLYPSGYPDDAITALGALGEGIHLLAKPFTRTSLLAEVREVIDAPH